MKRAGRTKRTDQIRRAYTCSTCGGAVFLARDQAKAVIKQNYPGDHDLRPYPSCDGAGFHVGHLAPEVIAGDMTREQYYGPRTEER